MRIVLLPVSEGEVIAREEQFGHFEGEFFVSLDGQVFYRHPSDSRLWFASHNGVAFNEAATAWNCYCDEADASGTAEEQNDAVARLRTELSRIAVLNTRADNLWGSLLEQASNGQL